ncbi:3-dehydroquinate synthase [Dehalogenimonas sp. WBC-2]|nr:3-dehydroquinate synthase [Dehalogenimonas sp. WBC-2]
MGEGLLTQVPGLLGHHGISRRLMVITNQTVARLYGDCLMQTLKAADIEASMMVVSDGEASKSLVVAGKLYEGLANRRAERNTPILALGGGVVGDLAGFVAATFQRGVPFVQIPTTLLAQVDSSIGGKVAVNTGKLKNMAGTFHQPRLVISDTAALKTLPMKEIRNGLAEVIKCAIIEDTELFSFLEGSMPVLLDRDIGALTYAAHRAAEVKARIVEKDERDIGIRHILNFGHTFGHAIECVSGFKISHGTSVAIGMALAARLANRLELLDITSLERILRLIAAAGLPVSMPFKHPDAITRAMQHDKKITDSKLKFILPSEIGSVTIKNDIDPHAVAEVLAT